MPETLISSSVQMISKNSTRMLVLTLTTMENEFEESISSIRRQTYHDFTHLVLRGLPSMEAHKTLYETFVTRSQDFELMVKVDGDIVLENENVFRAIVDRMDRQPSSEIFSIKIHDFFTDRLISGLNTYRNTVRFPVNDPVQPDASQVSKRHILVDRSSLGRGVRHCKDPSLLQALHFGIHRGVKSHEWLQRKNPRKAYPYLTMIGWTWKNFLKRSDKRLALAVLGGELGVHGLFNLDDLNHYADLPQRVLRAVEDLESPELKRIILQLRREAWGCLPPLLRTAVLSVKGTL